MSRELSAKPVPEDGYWLYLDEPPSSNRWWRNVRGRMVTSKAARDYKRYVAGECVRLRFAKIAAPMPVAVELIWWRGRKSGDLDKRLGIALDSLQGTVYDNDGQIVSITARRYDMKNKAKLVVHVRALATVDSAESGV